MASCTSNPVPRPETDSLLNLGPRSVTCFLVAATCALTSVARADDLASCNAALVQGQELARAGRLLAARAAYPACLRAECDESLRAVCANFVADLGNRIPSLLVEPRGEHGRIEDARVYLDGRPLADARTPIELDPGEYAVRVEAPKYVTKEERVVVAERERPRSIVVPMSPVPSDSPQRSTVPAAGSTLPASVYVVGAVSLAAVGSFGYFALRGKQTESDLRASCPTGPCDSGPMRREYLAADISLGVAIVAAGAALWIALTHHRDVGPNSTPASHSSRDRHQAPIVWSY